MYRTLVSHPNVHVWYEKAPGSIASIDKLYTRAVAGQESDEIERWFDREIEQPASEAIERVVSDATLRPHHWDTLIRFLAAQFVRTPAFLVRRYPEWHKNMARIITSVLEDLASNSYRASQFERQHGPLQQDLFTEHVPLKILTGPAEEPGLAAVKVEMLVGRAYWHFVMRHVLANTVKVLQYHRWSVVKPCDGLTWFTSDDPVIALNYSADGSYDFGGGWGRNGSEIFLPLSPSHLLYTTVGQKPVPRGTLLDRTITEMLRKFIAEHAYHYIFAATREEEIPILRPRVVNESRYRQEQETWKNFATEQATIEARWANSDAA